MIKQSHAYLVMFLLSGVAFAAFRLTDISLLQASMFGLAGLAFKVINFVVLARREMNAN